MARDADGAFTATSSSVAPSVSGTTIDPTDFNDLQDEYATALSESTFTAATSGTDNAVVRNDGTGGRKVQSSAMVIDDSGNASGIANLTITGNLSGATLTDLAMGLGSDAQGDIFYTDASGNLARLPAGTAGFTLASGGAGGNPSWSAAGSGDVTAGAAITDNVLVRGDGGSKGVQETGITVADTTNDVSGIGSITPSAGSALRTATGDTNTLLLQAYDVDGASYTTFATLTAGNTPTMDLAAAVTSNGGTIATLTGTQTVTNKTLTAPVINVGSDAHGDIYFRNTSGVFDRLAPGTSGQFLKTLGAGADPTWETLAGGGDLLSTNNLSDVASAATAFGNIKQAASETATGVVELATTAEAAAGTDTARAVTAAGVLAAINAFATQIRIYTSSTSWTKPTGLVRIRVTVVAGGGGGGGSGTTNDRVGSGGGAGGVSIEVIEAASLASTETVTVGAAGAAGTTSGSGGAGGTSSFGTTPLLSATGGSGGTNTGTFAPGAGGAGSGGDLNFAGQAGSQGGSDDKSYAQGNGGSPALYGVAGLMVYDGAGGAGIGYGGGGAGGHRPTPTATSHAGGAGAPGLVIVEEFF